MGLLEFHLNKFLPLLSDYEGLNLPLWAVHYLSEGEGMGEKLTSLSFFP